MHRTPRKPDCREFFFKKRQLRVGFWILYPEIRKKRARFGSFYHDGADNLPRHGRESWGRFSHRWTMEPLYLSVWNQLSACSIAKIDLKWTRFLWAFYKQKWSGIILKTFSVVHSLRPSSEQLELVRFELSSCCTKHSLLTLEFRTTFGWTNLLFKLTYFL